MARKKVRGKCVHCLREDVVVTRDHVFPVSWYPKPSAPDAEKWQMPSCHECNHAYGKIEDDFRLRIGMCLDPFDPASASVVADVLRALDHNAGKNQRDKSMRASRRRKLVDEMLRGEAIPVQGVYPGFEEKWKRPRRDQSAILIPREYVERIAEKIARGIFFLETGQYVEPPFKVSTYVLHEEDGEGVRAIMGRAAKEYAREPGVTVLMALANDGRSAVFKIELWGQFVIYASISDQEATSEAAAA